MNERNPAVAGTFYNQKPLELRENIKKYFENSKSEQVSDDVLGIIAPHAGYPYSGQCAAYSYNQLKNIDFDTAVIVAPSHRAGGFDFSIGNYSKYNIPNGELKTDRELIDFLINKDGFDFYHQAHLYEHSLEVQLPFLQVIRPKVKILPILFGNQNNRNSKVLSNALGELKEKFNKKIVFIISSDLSHFYYSLKAEKMDNELIDYVSNIDVDGLVTALESNRVEACGFGGILSIMRLAQSYGYNAKKLFYTHSGKVTGDNTQVVGYLSSVFYK